MAPKPFSTIIGATYIEFAISYIAYFISNTSIYHRLDGPALQLFNFLHPGSFQEWYYVFDIEVTKEDFYTPGFVDSFILEHS